MPATTTAHPAHDNRKIPIVGFSAYSGTGKTTLIEKLIILLKSRGLRLAVIKHDAHDFEIDHEGKDSWRFSKAGADMTCISSPSKTAIVEQRERSFDENLSMIHDVDLILVEGYKQEAIPRIGILRKATGKGLPDSVHNYIAIVTDDDAIIQNRNLPHFHLDDITGVADYIASTFLCEKNQSR
ncbi:MAG: molybdopterin-guanine dinucleotide biosynthesis protein B [Clostridiales bacterium]|nr:molybdopterin-guanine dinucleotide biosynthesis protein B [Clostridiales bacterium]